MIFLHTEQQDKNAIDLNRYMRILSGAPSPSMNSGGKTCWDWSVGVLRWLIFLVMKSLRVFRCRLWRLDLPWCLRLCLQPASPGYSGSKAPRKIKKRVEIWMSKAAVVHVQEYSCGCQSTCLAWWGVLLILMRSSTTYCETLGTRRRELMICDAVKRRWSTLRLGHLPGEAARRLPLDLRYSPTSPGVEDCSYFGSLDYELFGSKSLSFVF